MIYDLNENWLFAKEGSAGRRVDLPHDAMLEEKRAGDCPGGKDSGYFPGGKYRYLKQFTLQREDLKKHVFLLFEGVYRNAEVFVNGQKAGAHKYGYTEFSIDIAPFVKEGENELLVTVDNSLIPNCRWYSGSGIYRPVHLIMKGENAPTHLKVKTLSYSPAVIEVETDADADVEISESGRLIARGRAGKFTIQNAKLWSAETPNLYICTVFRGGETLTITFGIRTIEWSAKEGFLVNGKRTLLRGGCIHHDNGVLGACTFPDAEERRVRILKEQGFNALRMAHNPASRALIEACDKLGMYVLDECFDGWYTPKNYHDYSRDFMEGYQDDLTSMVEKDFNHPSVVMYSVGNEVTETAEERGIKLCKEMRDLVRSLDPTRPVTCGVNVLLDVYTKKGMGIYRDKGEYRREPLPPKRGYKEKRAGSAFFNYWAQKLGGLMFYLSKGKTAEKIVCDIAPSLDIVGLNYAASRYDTDAKKYPDRMMLGTETMASDLPYNWERVKKYPQLFGDFVWAAWDYLGEAGIGDWTYYSYKGLPLFAGSGMVDATGTPGAQMKFMRVVWGLQKMCLCVRPVDHSGERPKKSSWRFTDAIESWNWQGYEGKKTIAEVYADAYAVRLELNGKKLGQKRVKAYKALFHVRYRPGTLMAVALDEKGRELSRTTLRTGSGRTELRVNAGKRVLKKGELCYAEIAFTDGKGNVKPYIEQPVTLHLAGGGAELAGFGSALCKTDETFSSLTHTSYRGRALAVFRAKEKGRTEVTVSSGGVVAKTFVIEVK